MKSSRPRRFKTISEFHQFRDLPKPEHPLVSVIDLETVTHLNRHEPKSLVADFYFIALKRDFNAKVKYGQQDYDFDGGTMTFMAPGQVFGVELKDGQPLQQTGWVILIHPDFLWNTPLATTIKHYAYFAYAVHEALHLSEKEETRMMGVLQNIEQEYRSTIDSFSQDLIIAQLEVVLRYAERFYHRQFLTRKITHHQLLDRLEALLTAAFRDDMLEENGLPSVKAIADTLNVSPNYLSTMLKTLTGRSTQEHIHERVIAKAKEKLSTTDLSVSEIAYYLGFERSQSFSKLFKGKTNLSPSDFRNSFN